MVAAFESEGYRPRDELAYVMYTEIGQQTTRFAMRGDRTMFLFTFADQAGEAYPNDLAGQKALLSSRFSTSGWECPQILEALLAGQGTALAIVAAYILAGALHQAGDDYATAFARYKELFAPFVRRKQKAALRFRTLFGPLSKRAMFIRNQVMNLMAIPWIARIAFGRDLVDKIEVPQY